MVIAPVVKISLVNEKNIQQRMAIINQKNGVLNEKRCKTITHIIMKRWFIRIQFNKFR